MKRDIFLLILAAFIAGSIAGNRIANRDPDDPRRPAPGEMVISPGGRIVAGQGYIRLCGPDAILTADGDGAIVEGAAIAGVDDRSAIKMMQ